MLKLYYAPGACSMASHMILEESGEKYEMQRVNLAGGEQQTESYLEINPHGKVPVLRLESGEFLSENVAILLYLGRRFKLWPTASALDARATSMIGFFASSVHPSFTHIVRPERFAADKAAQADVQATGQRTFQNYLKEIDSLLADKEWLFGTYSVVDPYALVFYAWGIRRELPMAELKHYTAFRNRMLSRPAVQRVIADEGIKA